jgi:hypothetical protein
MEQSTNYTGIQPIDF